MYEAYEACRRVVNGERDDDDARRYGICDAPFVAASVSEPEEIKR